MAKKQLLVLCALGILCSSCVTYRLEAIKTDNVIVKYDRGNSFPIYEKGNIGMIIDPVFRNYELMIKITVKNLSSDQISIKDSDFIVESSNDRSIWTPIKVFGSREYYNREKASYIAGAVILVLGAAANSASAGYGNSYSRGTIYGNSPYGSYSGTYSSSTQYYDPAAAELARQRNAEAVANYAQNGQQWLEVLSNNLFYSKNLAPGEVYFGLVFSQAVSAKYYRISCKNPAFEIVQIEYERIANE
jgi:hypothetical protein